MLKCILQSDADCVVKLTLHKQCRSEVNDLKHSYSSITKQQFVSRFGYVIWLKYILRSDTDFIVKLTTLHKQCCSAIDD